MDVGGGGGEDRNRETDIFRADNPSCYPNAEVETTSWIFPS